MKLNNKGKMLVRELQGWGGGEGCKRWGTEPAYTGAVLQRTSEGQIS